MNLQRVCYAVLITLLMVSRFVLTETWYVSPQSAASTLNMTLSDIATGSTFTRQYFDLITVLRLLPGEHHLYSQLLVENILSLEISCSNRAIVYCHNLSGYFTLQFIGVVTMTNISFKGCGAWSSMSTIEHTSKCTLNNCHFSAKIQQNVLGSLWVIESAVIIENSLFMNDAILFATNTSLTLNNSQFVNITAYNTHGGAINAEGSNIQVYNTTFTNNRADNRGYGGAIYAYDYSELKVYNSYFDNNQAGGYGGAIFIYNNTSLIVHNSSFDNNQGSGHGGAMYSYNCTNFILYNSKFDNNQVGGDGGAIYASQSNVTIHFCNFGNNTAAESGGAVRVDHSNLTVHNSKFYSNKADINGGAIQVVGKLTVTNSVFYENSALRFEENAKTGDNIFKGGAIELEVFASNVTHIIKNCTFNKNTARLGACLYIELYSFDLMTIENCSITNNTAHQDGIVYVYTYRSNKYNQHLNLIGMVITNNTVLRYGVVYVSQSEVLIAGTVTFLNNCGSFLAVDSNVMFQGNINFTNNGGKECAVQTVDGLQQGGAVTAFQSNIFFEKKVYLVGNQAENGGALLVLESKAYIRGHMLISNNSARLSGGGMYAYQSELNFMVTTRITNNTANNEGGGIHAVSSTIKLLDINGPLLFTRNHARRGGAMFLEFSAKLYVIKSKPEWIVSLQNRFSFSLVINKNSANYGGAIYVNDHTSPGACASPSIQSSAASECFFQTLSPIGVPRITNIQNTLFADNFASISGDTLYGGLIDRCTMSQLAGFYDFKLSDSHHYIYNLSNIEEQDISSDPVLVCFCIKKQPMCSSQSDILHVEVKKGARFTISALAVDQVGRPTSTIIHNSLKAQGGTFTEGQLLQNTSETCTELEYNILSPHDSEQLLLYAEGPCKDIGISKRTVFVTFLPCTCPIGFQPSNTQTNCECVCDPALNPYITSCLSDTELLLREGSFWIAYVNDTVFNEGFIIVSNCPYDYCYPPTKKIYINFNHNNGSDAQCAFSRYGVLCGSCQEGLSLLLGSSRCMPCSNHWLLLLIPFAIAGIALLVFLLMCNITVAVGTINGLIFYANVIIANRATFLPFQTPNVLTVFIAWLNLDFGFESCFYNGMDGYAKVWLQLVFPMYVIFLVAMVITISEYSWKFSRLLSNRNPVATLATLILLSYAKLLRTIIAALSFSTLKYPDGSHKTVWLYDANIPYLEGKHIPLFIAALLILLVGLVFTLLLLFWQWFLRCPNKRAGLCWIGLNSFMDVYHAPYNTKHRYWTGLLLIARVVLYIISSLDHIIGDVRVDLIAIVCILVGLLMFKTSVRIYKNWLLNVIDNTFILNLLMFSVVTYHIRETNRNQATPAYTSTGIAFITFFLILVYHTLYFVLKKTFLTEIYDKIQQGEDIVSALSVRPKEESNTPLHVPNPMKSNVNKDDQEFIASCSYTEFDGLPTIIVTGDGDEEQPLIELHTITSSHEEPETQLDLKLTSHNASTEFKAKD